MQRWQVRRDARHQAEQVFSVEHQLQELRRFSAMQSD
jgi:hypothetical protein